MIFIIKIFYFIFTKHLFNNIIHSYAGLEVRRDLLKKSHRVIPIKMKIAKYCSLDLKTYPNMNT